MSPRPHLGAAVHNVATVGRPAGIGVPDERVVAGIAIEDVRPRATGAVQATDDRVVSGAAVDRVIAGKGIDRVVARGAVQRVVACRGTPDRSASRRQRTSFCEAASGAANLREQAGNIRRDLSDGGLSFVTISLRSMKLEIG